MEKSLPVTAIALAVAAIVFSTAPRAAQCLENGAIVACPPDAKLSFQQQAALPDGSQPLQLEADQMRPSPLDPQRYPGPSLSSDDGDDGGDN